MKEVLKPLSSYALFDLPTKTETIYKQFINTHQFSKQQQPIWSTTSTRQKLIAAYWLRDVTFNFATLFGLSVLLTILFLRSVEPLNIISLSFAGLVSYLTLYFFQYRPNYSFLFLPRLEAVKEAFEKKEFEQIEKCRQQQLPNLSLTLIYYVFDKTSGIDSLQANDSFAGLLTQLYGVDRGSLKTNLELILGSNAKRKTLTDRKRTEILNRFSLAYRFFEELHFPKGIALLKELEMKFTGASLEK